MKKSAIALVMGASLLLTHSVALAQKSEAPASAPTASEQDIQLLRSDIRSEKKKLIAENMKLTAAEAEKFWPVYDAYTQETTKQGDARHALVKEYANSYENMTDAEADCLVQKIAALDVQTTTVREQWIPKFGRCLPENRLRVVLPAGSAHQPAARSAVCREHSDHHVAASTVDELQHTAIAQNRE